MVFSKICIRVNILFSQNSHPNTWKLWRTSPQFKFLSLGGNKQSKYSKVSVCRFHANKIQCSIDSKKKGTNSKSLLVVYFFLEKVRIINEKLYLIPATMFENELFVLSSGLSWTLLAIMWLKWKKSWSGSSKTKKCMHQEPIMKGKHTL